MPFVPSVLGVGQTKPTRIPLLTALTYMLVRERRKNQNKLVYYMAY